MGMIKCKNCRYSICDWLNPANETRYCSNEASYYYGYNTAYKVGCEEGEEDDDGTAVHF